jgi:phage shock protein PspC (stress-responsive transcriptional regulator)
MAGNNISQVRRARGPTVLIAGVCGGLGEYFGIDPVIFRIIFAVVIFVYGTGLGIYIVLYLAGDAISATRPHLTLKKHRMTKMIHHDDDEWSDF